MNRILTLCLLALPGSASATTLTVWSHFSDTAEVAWLRTQASIYSKISGNTVNIVSIPMDKIVDKLIKEGPKGQGPDVIVTLPQDRFGQLVTAGALEPVDRAVLSSGDLDNTTIKALTYKGRLYGFPMFAESVGLVYNKKLIAKPPATWEEFMALAKKHTAGDHYGFLTDLSNAYMNYGLISAYGGYVFKDAAGTLDTRDIGLGNAGAARALSLMNDLRFKYKLVPQGMTGDLAKTAFLQGRAAMIVTGPWDMGDIKKAGIKYGITSMPTPPGAPNRWQPFVGVQSVVLNAHGTNKAAATEFARGLISSTAQMSFNQAGGRIPVSLSVRNRLSGNVVVNGFGRVISAGTPMPNVAEMGMVWGPWTDAISAGVQKPGLNYASLLDTAVAKMKKSIK